MQMYVLLYQINFTHLKALNYFPDGNGERIFLEKFEEKNYDFLFDLALHPNSLIQIDRANYFHRSSFFFFQFFSIRSGWAVGWVAFGWVYLCLCIFFCVLSLYNLSHLSYPFELMRLVLDRKVQLWVYVIAFWWYKKILRILITSANVHSLFIGAVCNDPSSSVGDSYCSGANAASSSISSSFRSIVELFAAAYVH